MTNSNLALVRSLNTRRLAQIVLAFLACARSMETEEVCLWTGLSREVAGLGLLELKGMGFLGVQTLPHNKKLWIPGGNMLFVFGEGSPQLSEKPTTGLPVVVDDDYKIVLSSDPLTSLTTDTQLSAFPTTGKNVQLIRDDIDRLLALKDAGIHGKKAKQLLALPWVTVEYIKAHWEQIKSEPWDNPQGMMIYRMEGEVPAPEVAPKRAYRKHLADYGKRGKEQTVWTFDVDAEAATFTGHEKGCKCFDCSIVRLEGADRLCPVCKHYNCDCEDK